MGKVLSEGDLSLLLSMPMPTEMRERTCVPSRPILRLWRTRSVSPRSDIPVCFIICPMSSLISSSSPLLSQDPSRLKHSSTRA